MSPASTAVGEKYSLTVDRLDSNKSNKSSASCSDSPRSDAASPPTSARLASSQHGSPRRSPRSCRSGVSGSSNGVIIGGSTKNDSVVDKALKEGNVSLLINLLGAPMACVYLIRMKDFERAKPFIAETGTAGIPKVSADDFKTCAWQNCSKGADGIKEAAQAVTWYATLKLQHDTAPWLEKDSADDAVVDGIIEAAGGKTLEQGDQGVLVAFAEAVRLDRTELAEKLLRRAGDSSATPDVVLARLLSSASYAMRSQDRKKVQAFCKNFSEKLLEEGVEMPPASPRGAKSKASVHGQVSVRQLSHRASTQSDNETSGCCSVQ